MDQTAGSRLARLRRWWWDHRASARVAFGLRLACMGAGAVLALLWTRLLLRALGQEGYGTYMAFLAFLGLAAAGELGMGGAVSVRTTQMLAAEKLDDLRRFHGAARRVFFWAAGLFGLAVLVLSPWLPGWLDFKPAAGLGSLPALFAVGAVNVTLIVYTSYLANTSYAAGTVMWPVLPAFFLAQAGLIAQVCLGFRGAPLWVLQCSAAILALAGFWVNWRIYRHSHPVFRERLPYPPENAPLGALASAGLWSYLFNLSFLIYTSTDRLIVNAFFGAGEVAVFQLNIKLSELAGTVVLMLAGVSMPKLAALLLHAEAESRAVGKRDTLRVARLQTFLAVGMALGYLWINERFIAWWFGAGVHAPLALEGSFAVSLALAATLDVYLQLAGRLSEGGLRFSAIGVAGSAVLNVGLSLAAAAWGRWLPGIGWATCAAQAGLLTALAIYVQRRDALCSPARLVGLLVAPVATVAVGLALRTVWSDFLLLGGVYAGLTLAFAWAVGLRRSELWEEAVLSLRKFGLFR